MWFVHLIWWLVRNYQLYFISHIESKISNLRLTGLTVYHIFTYAIFRWLRMDPYCIQHSSYLGRSPIALISLSFWSNMKVEALHSIPISNTASPSARGDEAWLALWSEFRISEHWGLEILSMRSFDAFTLIIVLSLCIDIRKQISTSLDIQVDAKFISMLPLSLWCL